MSTETEQDLYKTSDLYLSAYLIVKGHSFAFEKNGKKIIFQFSQSQDVNVNVNEYLMGKGTCEALSYANAIKNLKNLLFNR